MEPKKLETIIEEEETKVEEEKTMVEEEYGSSDSCEEEESSSSDEEEENQIISKASKSAADSRPPSFSIEELTTSSQNPEEIVDVERADLSKKDGEEPIPISNPEFKEDSSSEEEENPTQHTPSNESDSFLKEPKPVANPESEEDSSSEEEENSNESDSFLKEPTPVSNPESESGSESETESESDAEPTPQPLDSKPTKAQTQAQSTPALPKSGTKRVFSEIDDENDADKVKLIGKNSKILRVFSDDDTITILNGLLDFAEEKGKDAMKNADEFHIFMRKLMSADVTTEQLKQKVRSVRNKYLTSDNFTPIRNKKIFEVCKKVWGEKGSKEAEENVNADVKIRKRVKREVVVNKEKVGKCVKKETTFKKCGSGKKLAKVTKKVSGKVEGGVDTSMILSGMVEFDDRMGTAALSKDFAKRGLELMAESDRVALVERWKQLNIAKMEVFAKCTELIKDQARLVLQDTKK